jgi:hypothetical protein
VFALSLVRFLKNSRQAALTCEQLNSCPILMFDMGTSELRAPSIISIPEAWNDKMRSGDHNPFSFDDLYRICEGLAWSRHCVLNIIAIMRESVRSRSRT